MGISSTEYNFAARNIIIENVICDRCKKEFVYVSIENDNKYLVFYNAHRMSYKRRWLKLCDDCQKELKRFLNPPMDLSDIKEEIVSNINEFHIN
jgi:hypothetical protein